MKTDARKAIQDRLAEIDETMEWLSERLGRNKAYIQQFMSGKQQRLPLDVKLRVAGILQMAIEELDVSGHELQQLRLYRIEPDAFEEDAEPYQPARGSVLSAQPAIGYVKMTSNVLERHPLRIAIGDILAFDMSQQAVDNVRSEQIVLLQLYDKGDMLKARTAVREYVRPGLLVTNRETANEVFSLNDQALPFEPRIKGVFKGLHREAS